MSASLLVSLRARPVSDDVMDVCRREASRLEELHPGITGLWVTLGSEPGQRDAGAGWHVHLAVATPGVEVIVDRRPRADRPAESIALALHEACERAHKRLERFDGAPRAPQGPRTARKRTGGSR